MDLAGTQAGAQGSSRRGSEPATVVPAGRAGRWSANRTRGSPRGQPEKGGLRIDNAVSLSLRFGLPRYRFHSALHRNLRFELQSIGVFSPSAANAEHQKAHRQISGRAHSPDRCPRGNATTASANACPIWPRILAEPR